MRKQRGPLIHRLTKASKEELDKEIEKAIKKRGLTKQAEALHLKVEELKRKIKEKDRSDREKRELEKRLAELEKERTLVKAAIEEVRQGTTRQYVSTTASVSIVGILFKELIALAKGGCYPGSAIIYDLNSRARRIESLQVGDKVLVITNNGIQSDTVITFIHRQPEIVEEFLQIVTKKEKILLITADHLLFVEVTGQSTAIPARDVKIGDTVYVRGSHGSEKDLVQSISTVYEKGAYAPVTLSGTILVNDVHTSCYFDVLSHEWSHRAMSIARALHYVSPSMVRRISAIGEKDGFPGWCRLAHTMLTLLD